MTPEQVIEKMQSIIAEKTNGYAKSEEIEGLKSDLSALKTAVEKTDATDAIKSEIAKLDGQIAALKESTAKQSEGRKSIGKAIMDAFQANLDGIKEIAQKGGLMKLDVKAAGTMTIDDNYSGGVVGLSDLEQGVTRVNRRRPFMRSIMNTRGTNSTYVTWIEQANPDPNEAGMTAEGALKAQQDFDLVEASKKVKKVTAFIKVSKEMIADIPFMQGEINGELMELVDLKLDSQLLTGDDLGENLAGVMSYAQPFTPAANFVNSIPFANNADVLRIAIAQIAAENFEANYIILHPEDVAAMELAKSSAGEYVYPMYFVAPDGTTRVKGIPVIENTGIASGEYLVGDFTKANLRMREEMNVQVGYVNDDFTKNLMTVLCELRAVSYVKSNHVKAFVKGEFATDIAAIIQD